MKMVKIQRLSIALFVCATAGSARADTAARINSANELVRQGDFTKAIENYPEIAATDPNQDDLNYNLGVAHYRHGDIEAAKPFFREASTSGDASIAAAARYNLGNCFYSDAVATADHDKPSAIESLTQAILHYRASLRANPGHVDARANIELAVQLRDTLTEEQQQEQEQEQEQEQQQQDQQTDPEQQDQEQQNQENQESSSENGDSDQQQDRDAPSEDQQPSQEQSEQDQSSENDETSEQEQSAEDGQQQESDQPSASGQPPSAQDDQSATDQAAEEPSVGERSSDELAPQAGDAAPDGELNAANEQSINDETTPDAAAAKEGLMTREEALKMLQAVRDRDMLRRLRQEQLERRRHVPTERDW